MLAISAAMRQNRAILSASCQLPSATAYCHKEFPMSKLTRRDFVKAAATASSVFPLVTIAGTKASGRVLGANDTIRVGVAGINGRGGAHINEFAKAKNCQVTYLIDPDSRLFESRTKTVRSLAGNEPKCVQDVRKALEDKELDVISIATTNHWHSLITIWACQAGKDVYVEKPLSHNVFEGRKCVEAARRYGRMVQHGTQSRSNGGTAKEIAAAQSGKYGKLLVSKGYCCKPRWSINTKPIQEPPKGLDFDIWTGPAPKQPYHGNLVHYNWHWFWDFGNGDIGNQGVHEMDIARWAIKGATLPTKVWGLGGRFGYKDQGQTANTQMAVMEYGDVKLVFEVRGLVGKPSKDPAKVDNEFYTTEGMIAGGKFHPKGGGSPETLNGVEGHVNPGGHFGSFLNAVRSRRVEDLNADVLDGHLSSALCHLANISYRLGERVSWDQRAKALGDNKIVVETFEALQSSLTRGLGLKLDGETYQLGAELAFDPSAEKFINNAKADRLLTREYREPYVVPEKV
jgi:predicted dehydrogenase